MLTILLVGDDGYMTPGSQPEARGRLPFMDHWNASRPHVSLTDIIKEELALQKNVEKVTFLSRSAVIGTVFPVALLPFYYLPISTMLVSDQAKSCRP